MGFIRYLLILLIAALPLSSVAQNVKRATPGSRTPLMIAYDDFMDSFTGINDGVRFDFYGNGTVDRMTWTKAGAKVGFLVLPDDSGWVHSAKYQMFSNVTRQQPNISEKLGGITTGYKANGFEALRTYDSNHDGVIDQNDPVFVKLRVWFNFAHDGIYDPINRSDEIKTLTDLGVVRIDIDNYTEVGLKDGHGNMLWWVSNIEVGPGHEQPSVYDVVFTFNRKNLPH
jgi:hypothetical protein